MSMVCWSDNTYKRVIKNNKNIYYLFIIDFLEGERERDIDLLLHLFMHLLVDSCMCPDQGKNPQTWSMRMML